MIHSISRSAALAGIAALALGLSACAPMTMPGASTGWQPRPEPPMRSR